MKNTIKRVVCLALAVCMLVSAAVVFTSCRKKPVDVVKNEYTYNSWSTALGNNWNPHTWETNADDSILSYLSSPFVTIEALDTEEGLYQWVYEMATSITDVTATHQSDLTKYNCALGDKDPSTVTAGYVYEIKLNPNAKWENGDPITADDYIYSMKQLLDSKMRNYRANLYIAGESALAGAFDYYNSEAPIYESYLVIGTADYFTEYSVNDDGYATVNIDGKDVVLYTTFSGLVPFFGANSMNEYADAGYVGAGYFSVPAVEELDLDNLPEYIEIYDLPVQAKDENGKPLVDAEGKPVYVQAKDENGELVFDEEGNPVYETETAYYTNVYAKYADTEDSYGVLPLTPTAIEEFKGVALNFKDENPTAWNEFCLYHSRTGEKVEYDTVGCYRDPDDDYTIYYVNENAIDLNYFLTSCTSTWLVYEDLYEKGKKEEGGLIVTNYGTSIETSMSYGTYKLSSYQDDKQVVFVQNENWYGFTKLDNGELYSETQFEVDGKKHQQYQTTKIVIDVMTEDVAKQKFFKGELTDYSPTAAELSTYALSDRLYKVDETYTMSFFFNTGLADLQKLDAEGANQNSVVLSNYNFRKAMSLAINRTDYVTVTQAWTPAYSLMNSLYHYDIYNDPNSSYRKSEPAMQAICNLYGVKYGEGELYATLEEAYKSINGYNLTEAKALMKTAHDELVELGLYTSGADVKIQIGWAKGALTDDDHKQLAKLNEYMAAACEGSGFGTVTFEAIGNINDRYGDVPAGKFAVGYGAWGGAAFYPFRNFQTYMDPDQYGVNELGCWDPKTEELTLNVNGQDYTMTWQAWSNSMIGSAEFADDDFETKLKITAMLEEEYLKLYYRIPLAGTTICSLLSYKVDEYTQTYNIMYGFGGFRLMSYNYTDAEWTAYVAEQGGTLNYT